jgi:hypothetical protein
MNAENREGLLRSFVAHAVVLHCTRKQISERLPDVGGSSVARSIRKYLESNRLTMEPADQRDSSFHFFRTNRHRTPSSLRDLK